MDTSIIDTLNTQHRALERISDELNQELRNDNLAAVVEKLRTFHQLFVTHVALEDSDFHPRLQRLAKDVGQDRATLVTLFAESMKTISSTLMVFFNRYRHTRDLENVSAFKSELRTLLQVYSQRMHDEEQTLYPMLEQLQKRLARAS